MVVPGPDGHVQMGSDLGHDLLGVAYPRPPAAFAAGPASTTPSGRGSGDDHLMPGHLLIDRDDHGQLGGWRRGRSVALPWCRWAAAPRFVSSNHGQSLEAKMAEPTALDEDHQIALRAGRRTEFQPAAWRLAVKVRVVLPCKHVLTRAGRRTAGQGESRQEGGTAVSGRRPVRPRRPARQGHPWPKRARPRLTGNPLPGTLGEGEHHHLHLWQLAADPGGGLHAVQLRGVGGPTPPAGALGGHRRLLLGRRSNVLPSTTPAG
jgi:hypothetical protein